MGPRDTFDPVGLAEIAEMLGVSHQRAGQIMDRRLHPEAPQGKRLKRMTVWSKREVEAYLLSIGRSKTW
jgi:predicted DNA-binding transcriptional regulator AlpA